MNWWIADNASTALRGRRGSQLACSPPATMSGSSQHRLSGVGEDRKCGPARAPPCPRRGQHRPSGVGEDRNSIFSTSSSRPGAQHRPLGSARIATPIWRSSSPTGRPQHRLTGSARIATLSAGSCSAPLTCQHRPYGVGEDRNFCIRAGHSALLAATARCSTNAMAPHPACHRGPIRAAECRSATSRTTVKSRSTDLGSHPDEPRTTL